MIGAPGHGKDVVNALNATTKKIHQTENALGLKAGEQLV
jgi:hypothetical protein